jgi:tRNA-dihydrouridine synthase A
VMLGRAAYHDPYVLAGIEQAMFGTPLPAREEVLQRLAPYISMQIARGEALHHIARHVLGLYLGEPGARAFRRHLSEHMRAAGAGFAVIEDAIQSLRRHAQPRAA